MTALRIDVWSDIACPWCYVGKRRLEAALARFEHEIELGALERAHADVAAEAPAGETCGPDGC